MVLGTRMLLAGGIVDEEPEARRMLQTVIDNGSALKKLAEFVEAQGGDARAVYDTELLPKARFAQPVFCPQTGYVSHIACDEVGICSLLLGGGRETKESEIDLSVGLVLEKKVGDYVKKGERLAYIHANDTKKAKLVTKRLKEAYTISKTEPEQRTLIRGIITK